MNQKNNRIHMVKRLQPYQARYSCIARYLSVTAGCIDLHALADSVGEALRASIGIPVVSIYVPSAGETYQVFTSPHLTDLFLYQHSECFVSNEAIRSKKVIVRPLDSYGNPEAALRLQEFGCSTVISIPLLSEEKVTAALALFPTPEVKFTASHRKLLSEIYRHLTLQVKSILLYQRLSNELHDRTLAETDLDAIFRENIDYICIMDRRGCYKRVNPAFQKRLNYPLENIIGQHICVHSHPEDRSYLTYLIDYVQTHTSVHGYSHRYVDSSGEAFLVEFNAQYIPDTDVIISTARDITQQKKIEARNADLEHTIRIERMKNDFFSSLSHELKSPLNIILTSLDLIRMRLEKNLPNQFEQEYGKFLSYAKQNGFRLLRLISNLLDYSKLEANSMELTLTHTDIYCCIRELVSTVQEYAAAAECTLTFQNKLTHQSVCYFDQNKLDRILLNLLSNSMKNIRPGGKIEVILSETPTHAVVTVCDNGCGIPETKLPCIFEPFSSDTADLSKKGEGSGTGLMLSRSLARLHGGDLVVQSSENVGTECSFSISKNLRPPESQLRPCNPASVVSSSLLFKVQTELSDLSLSK